MINQEEVNALLAAEIRNSGLNDALKLDVVKEKVMKKIQEMSQGMNEMENPAVAQSPTTFPNPDEDEENINSTQITDQNNVEVSKIGMEAGAYPLGVSIEPRMAIAPEVPDFLKNVEPGKIFVYDFNELSVGGENLSIKPLKTLDNPEISKSMQQMWSENGTTRVEVYQAKFEKAGEIIYDYKNGTSVFIEKTSEPDYDLQKKYQQNPYAAAPEKEIENYLRDSVDLDQKINDVIANIVKSYFLTNTERAQINNPVYNEPQPQYQTPVASNTTNIPQHTPIQEGSVTMKILVNDFRKVDTPEELIETIQGKSEKAKLIYEDKEIKKWILNDKEYFLPSDPMSIRKCYIK